MHDIRIDDVKVYKDYGVMFLYIEFRYKPYKDKSKRGVKNGSKTFEKMNNGEWRSVQTREMWYTLEEYKVLRGYRDILNSKRKDNYKTREDRKRLLESRINRKRKLKEELEKEKKIDQLFLEHPKVRLHTLF